MKGVDRGASPVAPPSRPRPSPSPSPPLPRGDCRFIVLRPDVGGQRCACQGFRRHGLVPGSSCECGHQACYHVPESTPDAVGRHEFALLQDRLVAREAERDTRLIDDLRPRLKIVEAKVEHGQDRAEEDIRTVCRAVQGLHAELARWRRMASDRFLAHEDRIDGLLDRCGAMADELSVARASLVAMDDLTMRLEDGMLRRNRRLKASWGGGGGGGRAARPRPRHLSSSSSSSTTSPDLVRSSRARAESTGPPRGRRARFHGLPTMPIQGVGVRPRLRRSFGGDLSANRSNDLALGPRRSSLDALGRPDPEP